MSPFQRLTAMCLVCAFALTANGEPAALGAFFNQPNFASPRLSPSGDKIAYIAQVGEHQIIGVRGFADEKPALIGRNSDPQYRWYKLAWANAQRLLVSAQTLYRSPEQITKTRYRATRLMGIDVDGRNDVILGRKWPRASFSAVQFQDVIVHLLPEDDQHVLMAIRQLDKRYAALHRMNVRSGSIRQIGGGRDGVMNLVADAAGVVRVGTGLFNGFDVRSSADAPWVRVTIKRSDDADNHISFAAFSADPEIIWVWDTLDDFSVLRQFKLPEQTFASTVLSAPGLDINDVILHPEDKVLAGYTFYDEKLNYVYTDDTVSALYQPVLNALPGEETALVSIDRAHTKAILRNAGDTVPPHYYLYDRSGEKPVLSPLGRQYPKLAPDRLAKTRAFTYTAADGWKIQGFLTVPRGMEAASLPLVVLPHGGPVARDALSWDQEVQFLASRGYAVFRMNFRGSSGYGRKFRDAAFKDWGGSMQDDITAGVQHLVAEGIADPRRIAIFGTSYGGYAALMGGIKTPELYQAIISYAGVTNLQWLENEATAGLTTFTKVFKSMDRKTLARLSPALRAEAMRAPVLIGHGDLDDRVNVRHSRRMASALETAGKPVRYLEFEDEIHGFLLQQNRLEWYAAVEAFLAEHIGN